MQITKKRMETKQTRNRRRVKKKKDQKQKDDKEEEEDWRQIEGYQDALKGPYSKRDFKSSLTKHDCSLKHVVLPISMKYLKTKSVLNKVENRALR